MSGLSRPIQIKANGIEVIKPFMRTTEYARGSLANAIRPQALGGQTAALEQYQMAAFLFPAYQASANYEFAQMSSAKAGMQLMNNHVNARNLPDHGFRAMMALIRETPRFTLTYGGFEFLPDSFVDELKGICASA